jgi:hypothetical protein
MYLYLRSTMQAKVTLPGGEVEYACNIVDYPAEVLTTANKLRFMGQLMYKVLSPCPGERLVSSVRIADLDARVNLGRRGVAHRIGSVRHGCHANR